MSFHNYTQEPNPPHSTFPNPYAPPPPPSSSAQAPFHNLPPDADNPFPFENYPGHFSPSTNDPVYPGPSPPTNFDILQWHHAYASCQRYFLDHGQHEAATQAIMALINILLPCQWAQDSVHSSERTSAALDPHRDQPGNHAHMHPAFTSTQPPAPNGGFFFPRPTQDTAPASGSSNGNASTQQRQPPRRTVSLIPYIRRLVITAHTQPVILHGLFGPSYTAGILPLVEIERRNFLFTAKSVGFARTKAHYDTGRDETVPFLQPLEDVGREEIENAEKQWSRWLAMEDWMVGERAPGRGVNGVGGVPEEDGGVRVKRESEGL